MTLDAKQFFEILAREHGPMLSVYLRAVVHDAAVEDDLFQETMLVAWRTIERFDRSRPFGPWLRGIAARLVMAHRRRAATAPRLADAEFLEVVDERLSALQRAPGDTLDDQLDALRDCLARLPEHYRAVVAARYADQAASVDSIAAQFDLALEAVKKRLQRARTQLLECLNGKLAVE